MNQREMINYLQERSKRSTRFVLPPYNRSERLISQMESYVEQLSALKPKLSLVGNHCEDMELLLLPHLGKFIQYHLRRAGETFERDMEYFLLDLYLICLMDDLDIKRVFVPKEKLRQASPKTPNQLLLQIHESLYSYRIAVREESSEVLAQSYGREDILSDIVLALLILCQVYRVSLAFLTDSD